MTTVSSPTTAPSKIKELGITLTRLQRVAPRSSAFLPNIAAVPEDAPFYGSPFLHHRVAAQNRVRLNHHAPPQSGSCPRSSADPADGGGVDLTSRAPPRSDAPTHNGWAWRSSPRRPGYPYGPVILLQIAHIAPVARRHKSV